MNKRSSAPARLLAVIALVVAFVVAVVVIGNALGGDSDDSGTRRQDGGAVRQADGPRRKPPASYVVESGDTLTSIARDTGVSVARIETLNPDVDPQILIAGETLKLR
jgi:LysM repeat protein